VRKCIVAVAVSVALGLAASGRARSGDRPPKADKPILLVDRTVIETVEGEMSFRIMAPRPSPTGAQSVPRVELPTVLRDDNRYVMYGYVPLEPVDGTTDHSAVVYATSNDGRRWQTGAEAAVTLPAEARGGFTPLLDPRPGVLRQQRFKALARSADGDLLALTSGDGLRWTRISEKPVLISEAGDAFYGRNGVHWSASERAFVLFASALRNGRRIILRSQSEDFVDWSEPRPVNLNLEGEDIWSATVFSPETDPPLMVALLTRTAAGRVAPADVCLATSRDGGRTFSRSFLEAWIRPPSADTPWRSMVATAPTAAPHQQFRVPELFFYVGSTQYHVLENRFIGIESGRYALELLAKGQVPKPPTEIVTTPFVCTGNALVFNLSTNSTGGLRAEFLDRGGDPIPGYTLNDFKPGSGYIWVTADPKRRAQETAKTKADLKAKGVHRVAEIYGDGEAVRAAWRYLTRGNLENRERIQWWPDWDISALEGRTVRLRILLHGADLFGFRTIDAKPQEGEPVDEEIIP
jgi:hypothetical protein